MQTNQKIDPGSLLNKNGPYKPLLLQGSKKKHTPELVYKTRIGKIDNRLTLRKGQLMVLKGKPANQLVFKLVGKITSRQGYKQNIAFIDGGDSFDEYNLSGHFSSLWKKGQFRERVYVSRAFTYPQLAYLIKDKLPNVLTSRSADVVVISDITLLFSDPDTKNKGEALGVFRSCVRFLAGLARESDGLFIVTVLESRDRRMDSILTEYGHVFARVR